MYIQKGVTDKSKLFFYSGNQKNNLFFYPLSAGHFYCDSNYKIQRDTFDSILIILVVRGSVVFSDNQVANRGEIAIIDCFNPHCYYTNDNLEVYWIHISGSNTYQIYQELVERFGNVIACDNATEKQIKNIYNILKNNIQISDIDMSKEVYSLFAHLFGVNKTDSVTVIENAIAYISNNFGKKLTIDEIANEVHLSASQFSRIFKRQIGTSPYDYIMSVRLTKAKEMLKNTSLPISEIAYRTGFQSDSNFIYFFKKREGISPLKFKKVLF